MKTQKQELLDFLKAGNVVDNSIGLNQLGIYAVSQRIGDLIADGHPIMKAWKEVWTRRGRKTRVRCYWLPQFKEVK